MWRKYKFGDLVHLSNEKYYPDKSIENLPCIELENIEQETGRLLGHFNSKDQKSTKNIFRKNHVLYCKLRPYLKKYYRARFNGVCSTEIWVLDGVKDKMINEYLFCLIQTEKFNKYTNISTGTKMPRADWKYVRTRVFEVPPIKEQQKIAEILSTWDKAIELKEKLIEQKKQQKKGLMQNLLTGKVRLLGFTNEWKEVRIKEILKERKEKSQITDKLNLYSLTIEDGVTPKTDRYNRQFLVKTDNKKYKITYKNDIVYNPANLRYGAISMNNEEKPVLLSPIYEILYIKDNNKYDVNYIGNYVTSERQIRIFSTLAEGTLVERKAVKITSFLNTVISIPSDINEQRSIAIILLKSDKEINLLEKELKLLKQQKKGLMQLLLTGIVRVTNLIEGGE